MRTSKYLRKAQHDYVCACCNRGIAKGTEYIDFETVDHSIAYTVIITHRRIHKDCDKIEVKYSKADLPLPVGYQGIKEMLIGKVIQGKEWFLLTQDWGKPFKYHKRKVVHDCNGHDITPEDIDL